MHETRRLLEAAAALSQQLRSAGVAHAFHGTILNAALSNAPLCDEIFCIVEGGNAHPFRRVRQACAGNEDIRTTPSPWNNRLHVIYHRLIPPVEIEILPAGEAGPRHLNENTTMMISGVPFLTISEFIRAKLKAWSLRRLEGDARDIAHALSHFWDQVDINRIPEQDMKEFVRQIPSAAPAWREVKRKYGMK